MNGTVFSALSMVAAIPLSVALILAFSLAICLMAFKSAERYPKDMWYPRETNFLVKSDIYTEAHVTEAQFRAAKFELEAKTARLEAANHKAARQEAEAQADRYKSICREINGLCR